MSIVVVKSNCFHSKSLDMINSPSLFQFHNKNVVSTIPSCINNIPPTVVILYQNTNTIANKMFNNKTLISEIASDIGSGEMVCCCVSSPYT